MLLSSLQPLGEVVPNLGAVLLRNRGRFGPRPAFAERVAGGGYRYRTWNELVDDVAGFTGELLGRGLRPGDRVAFITGNSYGRLVTELAVMCGGLVSVPIFAGYPRALTEELLRFSDARLLVTDDPAKATLSGSALLVGPPGGAGPAFPRGQAGRGRGFPAEAAPGTSDAPDALNAWRRVRPSDLLLVMYTSGTSGFPKGVQLTHSNVLSQQKALELLWKPEPGMRFLCYLPWHHSFGGLFERFFALYSGGCLAIDDSWGKDVDRLFRNFAEIRPNVYFSVPKVYQEIASRVLTSAEHERIFFGGDLKFVFTAAAPLPLSASDVFKARGVPVVEGWGLTETSPCCTLTPVSLDRRPGIVGFPIPGVEIRLAEENEIVVRGPNVMRGYFRNPEATAAVLGADGWFRTGDVGELTEHGLKILSRKDRMFKLSNGEKVFPAVIEEDVRARCGFVKHAYAFGAGKSHPFLLVFPNRELLSAEGLCASGDPGCKRPRSIGAFAACLGECLRRINGERKARFEVIRKAAIVDRELTIEQDELTPSFKLVPRTVAERYRPYLQSLEEDDSGRMPGDGAIVEVDTKERTGT